MDMRCIGIITLVAQVSVLGGVLVRRRSHRALSLLVYLAAATVLQGLRLSWRELALRWDYWAVKELLLRALMAVVALEIGARVFATLGRARRCAAAMWAAVCVGTAVTVWEAPGVAVGEAMSWPQVLVVEVLPRIAVGAAFLSLSVLAVTAWYRVPLDPLHRVLLFGVAAFTVCYAGPIGSADGYEIGRFVMYHVTPLVYVAILVTWAWAAWRDEPKPDVALETLERMQPWRRVGRS